MNQISSKLSTHTHKTVVCLTGGTGFLGSHLIENLRKRPDIQIRLLSRQQNKSFVHDQNDNQISIHQGDLLDLNSLQKWLIPNSTVINLAYISGGLPEDNLQAATNLAEACLQSQASRLIHCSTAVVAGTTPEHIVTEETCCLPSTTYEKTKLELEHLFLERLKGRCEVVILRPTAIFGRSGLNLVKQVEELTQEHWFPKIVRSLVFGKRCLNLVYVGNVTAAILFLTCIKYRMDGEIFIISDDDNPKNNYQDVMDLLAKEFNLANCFKMPIFSKLVPLRLFLRIMGRNYTNPQRRYSTEKLQHAGFRKPIPFIEGVRLFADDFKNAK